jgi:hypothetical protein
MKHGIIETPAFNNTNPTNLLSNGDFECWSAGTDEAPDGWTLTGSGASVAKETTIIKMGSASAKVTRAGYNCSLNQAIHAVKGIEYWKGRTIILGVWVYATVADRARIYIGDGVGASVSTSHSGGSGWEFLTITRTISSSATEVKIFCQVVTGDTSAYFDGAMCVEGSSAFAFSPKPAEEGVWADYSAMSTITGCSSFTTKEIYTKKIGKTVFVQFTLFGTSDSTSVSFTLPYTSSNTVDLSIALPYTYDNGASVAVSNGILPKNSSTVTFYKAVASVAWTASGAKRARGQFFYESA